MAKRKIIAALAALTIGFTTLAGCSSERPVGTPTTDPTEVTGGGLIGITMPTKSLERWNNDGAELDRLLKAAGYQTQLDYADNKPEEQVKQLENQINSGAKVLVIASVESKALLPTLQKAADAGIKILAYDRLLMDTPNVDYYATFDNELVGNMQGTFLEEQLGLKEGKGPFSLEPFAGSPDDNNASLFFKGAWDILNPYVESGKLVVKSGKAPKTLAEWTSIGILAWKTETAQSEMENRLNSFYGDSKVDAVLSPNDSLALGIAQALESKGYKVGTDWPLLTGQDADVANVKNILAGKQSMTVWKDTRILAQQAAKMVDQIIKGETVDTNNDTYENGNKKVPTYLLDPQVVVNGDVQTVLVASGFISADKLQ
jgi:putative multiple sugar transport system substrate-binding protein